MIITYASESGNERYDRMMFIPDTTPWKLTVEIENIVEGTDEDPDDFQTDYTLKLVTGAGAEEVIMNSEDLWGEFPEKVEEEAILDFFNSVVGEAASDLALTLKEGAGVYDLFETISRVKKDCKLQMSKAVEKDCE